MRILITGGAGFIGRHLVRVLRLEDHQVRVLDSMTTQVHGLEALLPAELGSAEFIQGDVRDSTCLAEALDGIDAVVHLAAETGVGQSMYEVDRYVDVNDRGTACLLQAVVASRRPLKVVLASSRAVYGEGLYQCARCGEVAPPARDRDSLNQGAWEPVCPNCGGRVHSIATHEAVPCAPGSVYAVTKLAQEHLCRVVGAAYGFPVVVLRYFNVFGPGQSLSNPYTGILSTFYARAKGGKAIDVFEDGKETRDFIYIDDVVEATRRALFHPGDLSDGAAINVGSGVSTSVLDLAQAMLRVGGWTVPIRVTGAGRVGDVRHSVADTRRARQILKFEVAMPLEEGLLKWLRWAEESVVGDTTDAAARQLAERGLYRIAGN